MASSKTLLDLPGPVVRNVVFSYLNVNELLRLRRVCTWTKRNAEKYLVAHPRSKKIITVNIGERDNEVETKVKVEPSLIAEKTEDEICWESFLIAKKAAEEKLFLETFLNEDKASRIRIPSSHFRFKFQTTKTAFQHPLIPEFLRRYAGQVRHLEMDHISIPMEDDELKFYENFPNLSTLCVRKGVNKDKSNKYNLDVNAECNNFPENFKNLKKIEFKDGRALIVGNISTRCLLKLFEVCKNLETFHIPNQTQFIEITASPSMCYVLFAKMKQILGQDEHKHFRTLDIEKFFFFREHDVGYPILHELTTNCNMKLTNVPINFLDSFDKDWLEKIAPHVLSVDFQLPKDPPEVVLPNVETIRNVRWSCYPSDLEQLKIMLKPTMYPALKKLEIIVSNGSSGSSLEYMWSSFPNLEELTIFGHRNGLMPHGTGDPIFLTKTRQHPFLQLTKLKILHLRRIEFMRRLTNASFTEIFRHLKLTEFHMTSEVPVSSFTSAGIKALTTGPFIESIECFPFHSWSLNGVTDEEFQQLARLFPNNQAL